MTKTVRRIEREIVSIAEQRKKLDRRDRVLWVRLREAQEQIQEAA